MAVVNLFGDLALDSTVAALTGTRAAPATAGQKGVPLLAVREDDDTIAETDGDLSLLRIDEEGRLKVASKTASFDPVIGTATTVGNTIVVDVFRASNVVFHVKNTGTTTLSAGTFVFEASLDSTDGTNGTWFSVQAVRSNANTIETSIALSGMAANVGYAAAWEASVNAYRWFRLRCSVNVTTNAIASWMILRGSYATEPIPAAQVSGTQAVSGTVATTTASGTQYTVVTAASTNAAVIKSSAASLFEISISNPTATPAFVKLYNKTTAPTVGTDVPVLTVPAPANDVTTLMFGTLGKRFATGLGIAVTAAIAANDTAVAVAGIQIHGTYV